MISAIYFYNSTVKAAVFFLFLGILCWTFSEYMMHRFIFHFIGEQPWLRHLHYVIHGMHHAYPTNPHRVIFPPFLALGLGGTFLGLFVLILPIPIAFTLMSGFCLGYCWYEFVHYANHQIKWRSQWLKKLKRHHLLHHHSGAFGNKNFGVTTVLWDRVFGTYLIKQ